MAELSRRANRIFKENDADLAIGDALFLAALADADAFRRRGANRSSNFMVDREGNRDIMLSILAAARLYEPRGAATWEGPPAR